MEALYAKAIKSQNTVMELFPDSFASLLQWFQKLVTQEVAAVSMYVDDSGREALLELRGSIFDY